MAMKAAITKVLSCALVFVILMSVMPVSVFAVQESSSSEAVSAQGDNGDCSSVVKFKGTATTDENKVDIGICYGSYYCKVKVEELLSNPGNRLKSGNEYIVCYGDSPKNIKTRDKLEVYGEYFHTCGLLQHVGNIVAFNNGYYIKKISSELLSINVWTDKSEYKIGETVTIYYKTNKKCTAKLTITKPDGGDVVYGPNEIPASTRSKSATAGYPTGKRTVVFEVWAGAEYKKATCYFDVVEEAKKAKIRGELLVDRLWISFYSFDVKVDEILEDPTGNLRIGETVNVYGHRSGPAQVDDVTVGDKVEVFGEYRGYVGTYEQIFLSDWGESSSDHYVKKIDKKPDLIIEDILYTPEEPTLQENIGFYVDVKNQGESACKSFNVKFILGDLGDLGDFFGLTERVDGLNPGASEKVAFFYYPGEEKSEISKLIATISVDSSQEISESREDNNEKSITIDIKRKPVEIKFIGTFTASARSIGFTRYFFKVNEVLEGDDAIEGDEIGVLVYVSVVHPPLDNYGPLDIGDKAEVYAAFLKERGKQYDPWVDREVWAADITSDEKYYVKIKKIVYVESPDSEYGSDDTYIWVRIRYSSPDPEDLQVKILYEGDTPSFMNLKFDSREKTIHLEPDQWDRVEGLVEFRLETPPSEYICPFGCSIKEQFNVSIPALYLNGRVNLTIKNHWVDLAQAKLFSRLVNCFFIDFFAENHDIETVNFAEGVLADYRLRISSSDELKAMALLHYVYSHSEFKNRGGVCPADPHDLIDEIRENGYFHGVCRDYTSLYNALATAVGLEVRPVTGMFENSKGHSWSEVMIDGEWVLVDSTNGIYRDSILCACKRSGDCKPTKSMKLWSDDEYSITGLPDFIKFSSGGFWPSDDHKKVYEHYPKVGGILCAIAGLLSDVTRDYSYNSLPQANALVVGGFSPVEISIYNSNDEIIAVAEDYYMSWTDFSGNVVQDEEPIGKIAVALNTNPSEEYIVVITGTEEGTADIKAIVETIDCTINIDYDDISVSNDFEATFSPTIGEYNLKIDYDGDGTTDEIKEPDSIDVIRQDSYSIQLHTGWNLISLPVTPEDANVLNVLSPVADNWNSVWSYEGGKWKRYDLTGPDFLNTLTIMEPGKGYWLHMKSDDTLSISGSEPRVKSIPLTAGWNLVGYNSLNSMPTTEAMKSVDGNWNSVWSYDGGNWKRYDLTGPDFLNSLTFMEPGKGYWLNMKSQDTWTLGA